MEWINLAYEKERWRTVLKAVTRLQVLYNTGHILNGWGNIGFSRVTLLHGVMYLVLHESKLEYSVSYKKRPSAVKSAFGELCKMYADINLLM